MCVLVCMYSYVCVGVYVCVCAYVRASISMCIYILKQTQYFVLRKIIISEDLNVDKRIKTSYLSIEITYIITEIWSG